MSAERFSFGKTPSTAMKNAVEMVIKGVSLRKAADKNGVAHQTLARYVKSFKESSSAKMSPNYSVNAIFTAAEEQALATYINNCSSMFYGLSLENVRRLAYQTATINFKKVPKYWIEHEAASKDWLKRFRKRNPSLSLKTPEADSLYKVKSLSRHNISRFYDDLNTVLSSSTYCFASGTRIYNLDEIGLATEKFLPAVNKVMSSKKGSLVTLCCIISASGQFIPPAMIFQRVHFEDHMLIGAPLGTLGLANPIGWMNAKCFLKVIEHFVKFTLSSKENPTLLIMDNSDSHINIAALNYAKEHGVIMLAFPPHSSNKMQPLDVSVYKLFKTAYNQAIDNFMMENPGKTFSIYDIAKATGYAFDKSMIPSNISLGFRNVGIYPPDGNVIDDLDLITSNVTGGPLSNKIEEVNSHGQTVALTIDHTQMVQKHLIKTEREENEFL